ncbi:MAG: hypothetical protein K9H84_06400 [Bacteroidales bacterium]|nr:hypothetical protein [Bacteroidales bacterium]
MKTQQQNMRPQDIVVLLKIIALRENSWSQIVLANELFMSQSEISQCLSRSKYAGLLQVGGKKVNKQSFMEFLQYGIKYVFPQQPGAVVRGVPTAHSAPPLHAIIQSEEKYVWPSGKGTVRGQSLIPLYSSVVDAVKLDPLLHELLALVDVLRVGRARERGIAVQELKKRVL